MISIIGKQMIFPNEEQTFVLGDSRSTGRVFILDRYSPDRIDLAGLTFRLDIRYKSGAKNTALLLKSIQEEKITLSWDIVATDFEEAGTVFIGMRGFDEMGEVRWHTAVSPVFVTDSINTPGGYTGDLSELEQMEVRISAVLDSERKREEEAQSALETLEGAAREAEGAAREAREAEGAAREAAGAAEGAAEIARNAKGPQGEQGEKGDTGERGQRGEQGIQGESGAQGIQGEKGAKGERGLTGERGDTGVQGVKGERGEKGEQGIQGIQGIQGKQGIQGDKGDKGDTGNGLIISGYYDTESALMAAQTEPEAGDVYGVGTSAMGYDIYIYDGVNGEWKNNGALEGPKGESGERGEKGDKGDTGETGAKGERGEAGEKGDCGAQGVQGIQGIQGERGETGDAGIQGVQGIQGIQGLQGERGEAGERGEKGDTGERGNPTEINGKSGETITIVMMDIDIIDDTTKEAYLLGVDEGGLYYQKKGE